MPFTRPDTPSELAQTLEQIQRLASVEVVAIHREAARSGSFGQWPDHLDPRLVAALNAADRPRPYQHQADAIAAAMTGRDVVLSTSTASGKSLAYQVPILDAVLASQAENSSKDKRSRRRAQRGARALMLFPTKALGRDQVESMRALAAHVEGNPIGVAVYDGDTPPDERRAARRRAHVVATNPDMLHRGMLPHHEGWASFLAALRYVVLDELHTYRGLFGAHVACVLRRLIRLCRHYGASPTFIASSATIANPDELFAALIGRSQQRVTCLDANAAPAGPRTTVVLNPKVVDETTGVRRDYLKVTREVTTILRERSIPTLAFCRTRKAVELLTRYMREDERADRATGKDGASPPSAIRGYRGGYLPQRRREIEAALRSGEAKLVAATNALELGIDIGGIDAVVLCGYPGTRAATTQRLGRAGRRERASLGVLCLSSIPLDQFVAADPSFLWGTPPEHARIDPENPDVLLPHLRCAAHEQAFVGSDLADAWSGLCEQELRVGLDYLAEHRAVARAGEGDAVVYTVEGGGDPAESVDLRGTIEENFTVIEERTGDVLAEVDFEDAPLYLHPGAIYAVEGRTHEVLDLQWESRKAFVRVVEADYYTEAVSKSRVRIIDPDLELSQLEDSSAQPPVFGQGMAHRVRSVPGFKKIRFGTHENIGFGPINLPDLELHTIATYWAVPDAGARPDSPSAHDPEARAAVALAVAHAIRHVAAMVLMCDVGDLGHVVTAGHPGSWGPVIVPGRHPSPDAVLHAAAQPYVVLFDTQPGGAGLASTAYELGEGLLERARNVVAACRCEQGCPTCMGPASDASGESDGMGIIDRADVVDVLRIMRERVIAATRGEGRGREGRGSER